MKMLTATEATQGARSNDVAWTTEGELVWVGIVCTTDLDDPDGGCGCGRAFEGWSSHLATTTALVRDLALSHDDVIKALAGCDESADYGSYAPRELEPYVDDMLGWWLPGTRAPSSSAASTSFAPGDPQRTASITTLRLRRSHT